MGKPIVAIIGRQNVGKSTLLNRVAGKPLAIVADLPGTTRDRLMADVSWQKKEFTLIDTGGMVSVPDSDIIRGVQEQAKIAIADADAIIFLVNAQDGLMPTDFEIADLLRRTKKPVLLTANKADNNKLENEAVVFHELGIGEPIAISAHHGRNVADLLDKLVALLPPPAPAETETDFVKVSIVGRPNVGKSMLLNAVLGEERTIVSDIPGTTRDAIDTRFDFNGRGVLLIDTAGIRRRGKRGVGVEKFSVIRALRAIDRSDVTLLVLDTTELLAAQDMHIAGYIQQSAKGIILIVNKWDLATAENKTEFGKYIADNLKFMPYAPILYTSAKFGRGIDKIMPLVLEIYGERNKRLPTAELNNVIQQALATHAPPRKGNRQLKIFSTTQAETNPPTFVFSVNDAKLMHFSYQRYLENRLRQSFGFVGTPIRLIFRTRGEK